MMKRYSVMFHRKAVEDALEVARFIWHEQGDYANAMRFLDLVESQARSLDLFPHGYRSISLGPPLPIRSCVVRGAKNYLLFFEIDDERRRVRILFVWDGRRERRPEVKGRQD
jgi:plasmid stabilization system protein ParE